MKGVIVNTELRRLLSLFVFLTLAVGQHALAVDKPKVAIKEAAIGDAVPASARKHLKLDKLLAEMEASLQANRKFEVLSRNQATLSAVRDEQKFANSSLTAGNAANEGALLNADYLVIPTVQDFVFYRSAKPVPNLVDKYVRSDSGRLEINAQILDSTTGSIRSTFYMKASFVTKDEVVNTRSGFPDNTHFTTMAKKVSAQMTDQLVDVVFPMKVLNIAGTQVFINRGQDGGLQVGEVLNVYSPGIALIDPDTGENLGSAETFSGTIKVSRVNPKFTIADVVEQGGAPFANGDIVRRP